VVTNHPVESFTLVGVTKFGSVGSIGGASLVSMDLKTVQQLLGKEGKYDRIAVAAESGVSQTQLVQHLKEHIPADLRSMVTVQTAEQNANDQTKSVGDALSFLTIALLAFGGIAVFVGAFIIFNTFSITVAQRAREFAMLRTVGATRAQVLRSVITEALLIGITASLLGLFAGLGIAKGLGSLFLAFGIDIPNAGLMLQTRTVLVALLVGCLVTLLVSLVPAVRATRVPAIAALREGAQLPRSHLARYLPAMAVVLSGGGGLLLAFGILGSIDATSQRLALIGLGAVALFLGVAMFSPQLVRPMASAVGWPLERATNVVGRLGRKNAVRNPSRTAVTAAALMIGLALVGFATIFAAELRQSANNTINREFAGNFLISSQYQRLPAPLASALKGIPGVQTVSAIQADNAGIAGGGTVMTNGVQPDTLPRVAHVDWKEGSNALFARMGAHDAIVDANFARDHGLKVGSTVTATTTAGTKDSFTVTGIYKPSQLLKNWMVRYDTFHRDWQSSQDSMQIVAAQPGTDLGTLKQRISHAVIATFPTAEVQSQQDIKDQASTNINQLLAMIYMLLAMSVVVSLFGIINTLVLSVYERTREIGMLRAIGTTRKQVRWLIRAESVITAVVGAMLGLLLGMLLAVLATAGLQNEGIEFALPIGQLLLWVVFAVFFGIVAAAWPARRAARLNVLEAVAYE
jgi:putative ABC transport system permease protein